MKNKEDKKPEFPLSIKENNLHIKNWSWKNLNKNWELVSGHTPSRNKPEYWKDGNIDWISISDVKVDTVHINSTKEKINELGLNNSSAKLLPKDAVLLSRGPSIGKICILPKPMATNQSFVGWITDEKLDSKFLYYLLKKSVPYLESIGSGSTMKTIYMDTIKKFYINVPPLPEQQRIVAKLDGLFAKIDQAIGLLEVNITHTQALMGSVLDEEFGNLDESDFEQFLNAVFIQNKTLVPNDKETYCYVGLESIESNTGKLVDFSKTLGQKIKSSKVYFEEGDVLYGKLRPYLNKVWVSSFDGIATTEILPFKANQNKLSPRYLAYYLRSNTFLNVVNANTSGARMPRASARFFKDIAKVPKVSLAHQNKMVFKFDKLFNHFEKVIKTQTQKLNNLKALKSSLLDQAFKGEL